MNEVHGWWHHHANNTRGIRAKTREARARKVPSTAPAKATRSALDTHPAMSAPEEPSPNR